jgi:hypothetical protein
MAVYDEIFFQVVRDAEAELAAKLDADILYFNAEIRMTIFSWFRETVEKMANRADKKEAIAIFLSTPGGQAEAAEKLVEVVRHHYQLVYFVVPTAAMSAGTIFCMSGDRIFMDYSSSVGPIDPQVLDREGKFLVPALGHLDKLDETMEKSRNNTIAPAEFQWIMNQDLAMLRLYEQARDLSVALLEKWLVQYKFKDWTHHKTTNPGSVVTADEKQARANEIATLLSNNKHWHSHGRMIGMRTLREVCKLDIDDFGQDKDLQSAVRRYNDTVTEYISRMDIRAFLYNSAIN